MNDEKTLALSPPGAAPSSETAPTPAAAVRTPALGSLRLRGVTLDVYESLLRPMFADGHPAVKSAAAYVFDLFTRLQPRDPVEELLVSQMLQTQVRITSLTATAAEQKSLAWAKMMYEAADRASNTFRRQMLALSEYRNPKKPATVTTIEQANIAQQQVVQNHPPAKKKKVTNELGCAAQANAGAEVACDEVRET